jgi:cytochrome c biogenesis protein ResB
MKNGIKKIIFVLFILCLVFSVTACSSPKSLARESYKLLKQMENAKSEKELESIFNKLEKIDEKARKLSDADQEIYEEELGRLAGW